MTIDSAAIRLTDIILGQDEPDLEQALKAGASGRHLLEDALPDTALRPAIVAVVDCCRLFAMTIALQRLKSGVNTS